MSRPIEATPPLSEEDSVALIESLDKGAGAEEMARRSEWARRYLGQVGLMQKHAAGPWIPVEVRLPDDGKRVLFNVKLEGVTFGRFFRDRGEQRWRTEEFDVDEPSDVTHWAEVVPPETKP